MTEDRTIEDVREGVDGGPVSRSFLFVMLECDRPLAGGARYDLDGVDEVLVGRGPVRTAVREVHEGTRRLVLRLPGPALSVRHARLRRVGGGWRLEDVGSTNGSYLNGERVDSGVLEEGDVIEVGRTFLAIRTYELGSGAGSGDLDSNDLAAAANSDGFSTLDPSLARRLIELERIAASPVTLMLCGETGTGKEVLARSVHSLSGRRGPFVAVNCGALTRTLAESQLFGHVRGAFSGAVADTPGFFRAANGGTLLLDEVADLEPAVQVSLLRVLQEREVVPVGAVRPHPVDVRVVAASPGSLSDLVTRGQFRADLWARLGGFVYVTPPLRDRRVDMGLLIAALLTRLGTTASENLRLSADAGLAILRHPWPMNIRSLGQFLARSRVLSNHGLIDLACAQFPEGVDGLTVLPASAKGQGGQRVDGPHAAPLVEPAPRAGDGLTAQDLALKSELERDLAALRGNVAELARQRGTARMQVYRWLNRLGLDANAFRRRER